VLIVGLIVGAVQAVGAQAPAPLTAATYPAGMKAVAQANGALQMKLKNNQVMEAAADAKMLASLFAQVEKFWAGQKKDDAVKLSQQAVQGFTDAATAAAAGDGMKAMMAAGNATATCKQCHGAYREGNAQEGFKFKAGTVTE
jgi:hypothetical protein